MKTQGRKNVHGKGGVRFKAAYTTSKDKSMLRNVVTQLIISEKVEVTYKVAKQISPLADRLVTYAKKGDLNSRRLAAAIVRDVYTDKSESQTALQKLFTVIGPRYQERNGGYTRVLKLGNRKGDNAPICLVSFVL
ncbi:MAG: 50S ribosomal protein L17 [Bacilli bacterium]|nr:50S ribosomal protein L17 [Bacilli bacterium]MCI7622142.1 50S ribosomal protein L17 [Bacilli bacterium]MDD6227369.1 50S ribosomal protein L17 [Bacilli bacterium]MDD7375228.1 50S ribosomal protein L17 [Bacilli bacterium]MDD7549174.1 50S ribosomal protein L17 [Bacilli bacterium]